MQDIKKVTNNHKFNVGPSSAGEHVRLYTNDPKAYKNVPSIVNSNESIGNNSKKSLQLFFILFGALTFISIIIAVYFTPKNSFDTGANINDTEDVESIPSDNYEIGSSSLPKMSNVPPSVVNIGDEYKFTMRISDADTDIKDIVVKIKKGPPWLSVDGFTLLGVPNKESGEAEKIIVTISDGENIVEETFYIFIEPSTAVYPNDDIVYELHD